MHQYLDIHTFHIHTHSLIHSFISILHQLADLQTPQAFLDKVLEERGYTTKKYSSLEGGYYCRPTPLQQASYGSRVNLAIRAGDTMLLRRLLDSGLSPNPCNNYGESLVHMVCRRGDHRLLGIMLEAGCSLQVTDDYGRTPLHDACWRADPSFDTVKLILDSDRHLLHLLDCRGAAPLSYVKKENYSRWINFLQTNVDMFWPRRDIGTEGEERPPPLTMRQPHSLPIPDPGHALPLEVAAMVSNGRMEPEEAVFLDDDSSDEDDDDDSSYDSEDDSSYDSEDENDDEMGDSDEDSDFDADEMAEICLRAGGPMAVAKRCFGKNEVAGAMATMSGGRKKA
jgi:ankyrin repeat protein